MTRRPWWKKKRWSVPLMIGLLLALPDAVSLAAGPWIYWETRFLGTPGSSAAEFDRFRGGFHGLVMPRYDGYLDWWRDLAASD